MLKPSQDFAQKTFRRIRAQPLEKNIMHFISGYFTNAIGKFLFVKKTTTEVKLWVELNYPDFMSSAL